MYNPSDVIFIASPECSSVKVEKNGNVYDVCFNNYETKYSTFLSFIDLADNTIIYDRFKTEKSIYKNPSTIIDRKFTTDKETDMDSRMVETDDKLIDYINYSYDQINKGFKDVLYKKVVNDSVKLQTQNFNIYNITDAFEDNIFQDHEYNYYGFYVYHYNINKDEYDKFKRKIYLSKYRRYERAQGGVKYTYGYDYLNEYLEEKTFYYYIFDTDGNLLQTSDIISPSFDFSTIIPKDWLSLGKYSNIEDMLNDALIISGNNSFENNNQLVIYINKFPQNDTDDYLYLKYKGNKVTLAKNYQEYEEWVKKIFK